MPPQDLSAVLDRLAAFEARIDAKIDRLAAALGRDAKNVDDFTDIDPLKFYSVSELSELERRPVSRQSLYRALDTGRLKETLNGAVRGCTGADYISFLTSRRERRRGSRRGKP